MLIASKKMIDEHKPTEAFRQVWLPHAGSRR